MLSELILSILKNKITPNQFYLMLCYRDGVSPVFINSAVELRILKTDGWITEDGKLSSKAGEVIEKIEATYMIKQKKQQKALLGPDALNNIRTYREIFPKGILPSGVPGRINEKELEKKFTWFFNTFSYSWETVLETTRKYVDKFTPRGYHKMRNSGYFISKTDPITKAVTSDLATYCEVEMEDADRDEFQIKIV